MSISFALRGFEGILTEDSELRSGARNRVRTGDLNLEQDPFCLIISSYN